MGERKRDDVLDAILKSPKAAIDLPGEIRPKHLAAGVWKYGRKGDGKMVYYVKGVHKPEVVIRTWTLYNIDIVVRKNRRELLRLLHDMGDSWKGINRKVVDELKEDGGVMKRDYEAVVEQGMTRKERAKERGVHPGTVSVNVHEYKNRYENDFRRN